jgi:hypothetical protein
MLHRTGSTVRQCLLALALTALAASSACAWMPKTHLYLSEQALRDALPDSKVDIVDTNGVLIGHYDCNPSLIAAIAAHPAQYRAGVVGADAYPDMATGRQLIRSPYPGTDAWLNQLWTATDGSQDADRAFTAGFYSGAAGDLFGASFVNYYAGGSPNDNTSSTAPEKHTVIEGLTDQQMPQTQKYDNSGTISESDVSIEGKAADLIYENMVDAEPGSTLGNLMAGDSAKRSVPAVFSSLKYALVADTARFHESLRDLTARYEAKKAAGDACGLLDLSCSRLLLYAEAGSYALAKGALTLVEGPFVLYKEAWIQDIESGLRAWPTLSHEINRALNCGDSIQVGRARTLARQYVTDHLISMSGAPDALGSTLGFINSVLDKVLPASLKMVMGEMDDELLDFMCKGSKGQSADQWANMAGAPDSYANGAGINAADFRSGALNAPNATDTIDYRSIPAMHNAETMIKLSLMSRSGVNALLRDLGDADDSLTEENIMQGSWFGALGESRQWASLCSSERMILAQRDSVFYKVFKHQVGESSNHCPPESASAGPDVVSFNTTMGGKFKQDGPSPVTQRIMRLTMQWDGAVRIDCRGKGDSIPHFFLYESDGTTELGNGSDDPTKLYRNMYLTMPGLHKGDYVLKVYSYYTAPYTLTATPSWHSGNDAEPNDSVHQSIALQDDSMATGWVGDIGDFRHDAGDWYRLTLTQAAQYHLAMVSDTTLLPRMDLYDQDSVTELDHGYSGTAGYADLTTPLLSAGTYFVWVTGYGEGGYSLRPSLVLPCATDIEPNDAASQAVTIPLDSTITAKIGQVGGISADVEDWYAVTIGAGTLTLLLETNADLDASLTLYGQDSSSELASVVEKSPKKEISRLGLPAGTYFAQVRDYVGDGCYQLRATQPPVSAKGPLSAQRNPGASSFRVTGARLAYSFSATQTGPGKISIYSTSGRLLAVYPTDALVKGTACSGSVALAGLPKGLYCLRVTAGALSVATERVFVR